ncbi:MAG: hypothetical protein D3915_15240 [Candidatus Electrothrix sp. AU1_5]|nr:hypothetical protein [Candidatus Electrothrix gigas]
MSAKVEIYDRRRAERIEEQPAVTGRDCVIAETDGSMVPIVVTDKNAEDRRKGKKYSWKEARLCFAHIPGETTLKFGAEFQEGVDEAGKNLFDCACRAGFGVGTYLHSVGDGAPWIYGQIEKQFGDQGNYLIDFYHVCEYLEAAATACSEKNGAKAWSNRQKALLKEGRVEEVKESLKPHLEPEETEDQHAPVRSCLRYLHNRPGQFDYLGAQVRGLPIGSGEIESAHRYIIQAYFSCGNLLGLVNGKELLSKGEQANTEIRPYNMLLKKGEIGVDYGVLPSILKITKHLDTT